MLKNYFKTATLAPNGNQYTKTTYPLLGEIVKNCPQVQAITHIQRWYYPWLNIRIKKYSEPQESSKDALAQRASALYLCTRS